MTAASGKQKKEKATDRIADIMEGRDKTLSFINNSVHRLRSTMTVIRIYNELIQSGMYGPIEGEMVEKLGSMESTIEEISGYLDIVRDITSISELPPPHMQETDLFEIALDVMKGLSTGQSARIRIASQVNPGPTLGALDRNLLRSALRNILSYCLHHSSPGSSVTLMVDGMEDRPFIRVIAPAEPVSDEEVASLIGSLSTDSSSLSAQEWRSLCLPVALAFWGSNGGSLKVEEAENGLWSYTIDVEPTIP